MDKIRVILVTQFLLLIAAAVAAKVDVAKTIVPKFNPQLQAYEYPRFQKFVTHCTSHVAENCSGTDAGIQHPHGLANCLFNSMEKCLVNHGATLFPTSEPIPDQTPASQPNSLNPIIYQTQLIESLNFRTVLKTCSHMSARGCWTGPNVVTSKVLEACLIPSMNQCVYPLGTAPSDP